MNDTVADNKKINHYNGYICSIPLNK